MQVNSITLTILIAVWLVIGPAKGGETFKERLERMKKMAENLPEPSKETAKPTPSGTPVHPFPSKPLGQVSHPPLPVKKEESAQPLAPEKPPRIIRYPGQVTGDSWERHRIAAGEGCTNPILELVPKEYHKTIACPPKYAVDLGFELTVSDTCPEKAINDLIREFDRDIDVLAQPYSYPLLHGHPGYDAFFKLAQKRLVGRMIYEHVVGQDKLNVLRDFLKELDELVVKRDRKLRMFEEMLMKVTAGTKDLQTRLE